MPLVRAKTLGFHNGNRVRVGTTFSYPDDRKLPSWVELVGSTEPTAPVRDPDPEPSTKANAKAKSKAKADDSDLAG